MVLGAGSGAHGGYGTPFRVRLSGRGLPRPVGVGTVNGVLVQPCHSSCRAGARGPARRRRGVSSISNRPPRDAGAAHPSCLCLCDRVCRARGATPRTRPVRRNQCSGAAWSSRTQSSRLHRDHVYDSLSRCPSPHLYRDEFIPHPIITETPTSRNTSRVPCSSLSLCRCDVSDLAIDSADSVTETRTIAMKTKPEIEPPRGAGRSTSYRIE